MVLRNIMVNLNLKFILLCFQWVNGLVSFNNLLQIVNSTVNYVIYFCHCYKTNGEMISMEDN